MDESERMAAKRRLKEAFREEIMAGVADVERACAKVGPALSRADVLRGMKCCVAQCVASAIRKERQRGAPVAPDLLRIATEAFNEALDELAALSIH